MKICKVDFCEVKVKHSGYCNRHYQQIKNWGEIRRSRGDKNEIIINDDFAEIILYDIDYKEKARAIIDVEDVERCKLYKWTIRTDGYVSAKIDGKGIKLHRFIANTPKGMHTDHINRDRLDNRRLNLRICTQSENNKNKGVYKNNSTGRRGLTFKEGYYQVDIRYDGKDHYIGYFKDFDEAVKARELAEIEFYGKILDN